MDESIYVNINADGTDQQHGTTDASADTRKQTSQHTGSECVKNRSHRSVLVCLVVMCVLLLTAVIVLCVLIYTNNHQFNINNKTITEERDQLLTNNINLTEERDQLLTNNINLTEERDQLLTNNTNLTEERDQQINKLWRILNETDGWIYYHYSFYFISFEKKSWSESRRYCRERGADLIIINNKEEQNFAVKVTSDNGVWIGLSGGDVEGNWKWVDNSTMTSGFWKSGQDTRHRKKNCAASYSPGWYTYSCASAFKWMCERNMF